MLADLRAGRVKAGGIVYPEHPLFYANFVAQGEP
jgi:hypothetical protein